LIGKEDFSFSRRRRLDGPNAFAPVFAYKCWLTGRWFQVFVKPSSAASARLGVVVSKRIMKRAVTRNAFKRLTRDVFRQSCATIVGVDFVVRPRAVVDSVDVAVARAELKGLFQRAVGQCLNRQRQHAVTV